jgi:lipoate-protein ligase A
MVVVGMRLHAPGAGTDEWLVRIADLLADAVAGAGGPRPAIDGHGDLSVGGRKILGASLRRRKETVFYLAAVLVDDAVPLMERYLAAPSREPTYREGRSHRTFCTHLGHYGVSTAHLAAQVAAYAEASFAPSSESP